ncbi:2Fe-2S iron-sulfur cluster-binding protein [Sinimarinibacterium sp. NLF-5-8]|uniref:2Fe-2S iron-sulfur cluster-binding protein n=1 Tax=Sinimarinibacterium sp. NLF-5-8 TaxID=2698684 RepID=UPI00137C14CE|nr:2Fe-2S iron-sulfur cluster-binding protein [Sinimarinibacterium sp. NLF-5-8]QHS09283.1 2Fe-2S iron-sulfur cluster binding domain-containing protein [Sinimarinibacterium sp. NLF-5-8]
MSHQVYLQPSSQQFAARADETLLAAGLRQDLLLPHGCQSGRCGSCRARLISGVIEGESPALSEAERKAGFLLMCQTRARSDVRLDVLLPPSEALRPRQLPCRLQSKRWLAHDVLALTLKLPRGTPFAYLPGQYIDLLLADGQRRSFSIANAANGETLTLQLRITPQGRFAQFAVHELAERSILRFEGPLGAFYLRQDARAPMLMVGGGTGIAPLRAMLEQLIHQQNTQPVALYWGVRAQRDAYLHDELQQWAQQHAWLTYQPVLSQADDDWQGRRGWVHLAVLADQPDLRAHRAYLAGPPLMIHAAKRDFAAAGLASERLHYDAFEDAGTLWRHP